MTTLESQLRSVEQADRQDGLRRYTELLLKSVDSELSDNEARSLRMLAEELGFDTSTVGEHAEVVSERRQLIQRRQRLQQQDAEVRELADKVGKAKKKLDKAEAAYREVNREYQARSNGITNQQIRLNDDDATLRHQFPQLVAQLDELDC